MRNRFSFFGDTQEDDEHDSLKEALIETSPYLLALTLIVSLLHSVFELLAFKNGKLNHQSNIIFHSKNFVLPRIADLLIHKEKSMGLFSASCK